VICDDPGDFVTVGDDPPDSTTDFETKNRYHLLPTPGGTLN